jgi:microcin C transport system substrate-binding protein
MLPGIIFAQEAGEVHRTHAIAMHGAPKYGADFENFEYTNPDAPKGGKVIFSAFGSFDSLHPFILKGQSAAGVGNLFETLTTSSSDEAFSRYGLLAESIEWPEDRSWVAYTLRPEARWHDGQPVTVEDVIWSLETLKTKGHPGFRQYFANVENAEQTGARSVRFNFSGPTNRELPLIVGELPILPRHYWQDHDFEATTLEAPLGSGPYRVAAVDPGRSITFELDPNYWGKDLPVNRGKNNYGIMHYEYYRDRGVQREGFKAGKIDFFSENVAKEWATAYDLPAVRSGIINKRLIAHENPQGMQAFVFNTRREIFKDRQVRAALAHAFDFEWTNQNLFYGAYKRSKSYFSNSELASGDLPSESELAILESYRDQLPAEVFTEAYEPPATDGSGNLRGNLRTALRLLKGAGWDIQDGVLTHTVSGLVMQFEIMLVSPDFERVVLPFTKNMERLGIKVDVRTVDTSQYQQRTDSFDFDMIVGGWGQSLSPGNEQRYYWHSLAADIDGSRNTPGIRDAVVDALIDLVISAPDRESLINRTRAMDRVLLWNHYVIPHWHLAAYRVLYWDKFGTPEIMPKYDLGVQYWWIDPDLDATLAERRNAVQ